MSSELRSKFRALKRLHSQRQEVAATPQPKGAKIAKEDTDDETSSSDNADLQAALSMSMELDDHIIEGSCLFTEKNDDPIALKMAISTAISAQNEIDALMGGIAELESFMNTNQGITPGASPPEEIHKSTVEDKNKNSCIPFVGNFDV